MTFAARARGETFSKTCCRSDLHPSITPTERRATSSTFLQHPCTAPTLQYRPSRRLFESRIAAMRLPVLVLALLSSTCCSAFVIPHPSTSRLSTARHVAIDTSDIKNGLTIELDGEPYKVLNFSIMKQARGAAKTTIKFKNLIKGTTIENTYRSGEKFQTAMIEKQKAQYTYKDGVSY